MMVHTSKTKQKEIPTSRPTRFNFARRFLERLQEKRELNQQARSHGINIMGRRAAMGRLATFLGIGVVTACAPALVHAEPKEPVKNEVNKERRTRVPCKTFSDPNLFKQYLRNAEGKVKAFSGYDIPVNMGVYVLTPRRDKDLFGNDMEGGTNIEVKVKITGETLGTSSFSTPIEKLRYIVDDQAAVPALGQVVAIHDNRDVAMYLEIEVLDEKGNVLPKHVLRDMGSVGLSETRDPVQTAYSTDEIGTEIAIVPKGLRKRDVITIRGVYKGGKTDTTYMMYRPDLKNGTWLPPGELVNSS